MKGWIVGVDEAGRGPLAGPVAVGVVMAPHDFDIQKEIPGVADSKVLSEKKREKVYEHAQIFVNSGQLRYVVVFKTAAMIDEVGIVPSIMHAIAQGVRMLALEPNDVRILLDGSLRAPHEYEQETIIHGDALEPIISLASIMAKVERDRLMCQLALQYPQYGFERHKGYGTRAHYAALAAHGLSDMHRRSFCTNLTS